MSNTPNQEDDPNQNPYANQPPSENYGNTTPQPPPNYGSPQEQSGYGTPPNNYPPQEQGGYTTPSNYPPQEQSGYGTPPNYPPQGQGGYGPPPNYPPQGQSGYGPPPNYPPQGQGGYGTPPNYQQQGQGGYGYNPPPASTPLPLGEAIRQLPSQYIRALTKPSAATFAAEKGKAAWNIVWVQIAIFTIFTVLFGFAYVGLSLPATLNAQNLPASTINTVRSTFGFLPLSYIILTPLFFFIGTGIYHLLAKAFGGDGTYLEYVYSYLLYYIPITIVSLVLALIPYIGGLAAGALGIYGIVLQIFMTMGVHRLSGGRATLAVLILPIIAFVLGIILVIVLVGIIASSIHR